MSYPYEGYPTPAASAASGPISGTQAPVANSSPQPYQGNGTDPIPQDPNAGAPGTGSGPEAKTTLW